MAAAAKQTPLESIDLESYRRSQRSDGTACVLAIGTAVPPNVYPQSTFADFYFRVTRSQHLSDLKAKFQRICDDSQIKKRHLELTEELLQRYPSIASYDEPSLDVRQQLTVPRVPELGQQAAEKAIAEWGQPKNKITHLIFSSTSGAKIPGADHALAKAMGLNPSVKRLMVWYQGGMAGATVLRLAKDVAENTRGARVLVVCSETTISSFRGPKPDGADTDELLLGQALFGDGAAAAVVGCEPVPGVERPWFHIVWTAETVLLGSEKLFEGDVMEKGLVFRLQSQVAEIISANIKQILEDDFGQLEVNDWNKLFWIVHPEVPSVLEGMEAKMTLDKLKLRASREVLRAFGNMCSAGGLFVMDEMRKWSVSNDCSSTGEGVDYGVLVAFGAGLAVGIVVLKSFPLYPLF